MTLRSTALIARRELAALFLSPIAYVVIVLFLAITGWVFFSTFFLQGRADMRGFFSLLPLTLGLVAPAVTMRQWSEELATGTYEAVLTLPLTGVDVLMGKFVAAVSFLCVVLLPTVVYPISIATLAPLDWGPVIGGYIGALLLAGLYCACGLLASSLSRNQIIAFILALAACAFLALIDKVLLVIPGSLAGTLQFLGADYHFQNVARGVLDSRDLVYFLSLAFLALVATHTVMERRRG